MRGPTSLQNPVWNAICPLRFVFEPRTRIGIPYHTKGKVARSHVLLPLSTSLAARPRETSRTFPPFHSTTRPCATQPRTSRCASGPPSTRATRAGRRSGREMKKINKTKHREPSYPHHRHTRNACLDLVLVVAVGVRHHARRWGRGARARRTCRARRGTALGQSGPVCLWLCWSLHGRFRQHAPNCQNVPTKLMELKLVENIR